VHRAAEGVGPRWRGVQYGGEQTMAGAQRGHGFIL